MDFDVLFCISIYSIPLMCGGYDFDSETVIRSEDFEKHTIKLGRTLRNFFIFERRSQRTRFSTVAVVFQVSAYIYFLAGIIASVVFEWNPYIRDVALYSMAPFLLTICLFEIYYKYKSYKYKRNLPKNRNKTFWQYLRTRKK